MYDVFVTRANSGIVVLLIKLIGNVFTIYQLLETSSRSVKPWAAIDVCTTSISHRTHSHQSTELDEDLSSFCLLCSVDLDLKHTLASILTLMLLAT